MIKQASVSFTIFKRRSSAMLLSASLFAFPVMSVSLLSVSSAQAEMKALDDDFLSDVSGQSGLTLDLEANVSVGEVAYFEDDNGIALQGVRLASAADPDQYAELRLEADVLADGSLLLTFDSSNVARFEIEEIRFVDTPGVTPLPDAASLGGFFFDFEVDGTVGVRNRGNGLIGARGVLGGIYDIDLSFSNGRFGYRTNGNEFFLDGLNLDIESPGTVLGATQAGQLVLDLPNFLAELSVDAIRYSNNPANHGVTNDVGTGAELPSYGSLWAKLDAASSWQVTAGGRVGTEGLSIDSQTTINRLDLAWGDDSDGAALGYWAGVLGVTGQVDISNLTLDVLADPDAGTDPAKDFGLGLALEFDRIAANVVFGDVFLGETKSAVDTYVAGGGSIASLGSFGVNLLLEDASYRGVSYENRVLLQAGGNQNTGYQGIRLDTQLSLASPNNESNLVYRDDGYALMLSKLEGFVDGDLTLDVTAQGVLGGEQFYDGLRLGFEDFAFGYQVEGYRVADDGGDQNALKNRSLQSAQKLNGLQGGLFGLAGAPSMTGLLNGHITLGPGGNVGQEGITINSDLTLSNGEMAAFIESDGTARGIWLSGLNYDVHLRDMMLDVTDEGLRIFESESWSKMDVTDFRVGDRVTGASFGRLVLETYEQGSVTTIGAGGAGTLCIGGSGADQIACESGGGRWEDRGDQGITIASQRFFKDSIEAEGKRNRFTWETGRAGEGTATPTNGSGLQLVFDNFTTNDGDGGNDTYGLRTDTNIDIASAYVVKKSDGPDSNGVDGNKGDVKVMNTDGSYRYVAPGDLTAADRQSLPVGIATRTRTHFKELDFGSVDLVNTAGETSTLLYGLKLQNFDVTTDITVTPLD